MEVDDAYDERRREKRKKIKITVLLKMGVLLSGRGITKDISEHGMCLMCPQVFKAMSTALSKDFNGAMLKIMIPSESLTINGVIVWADLKKGEAAISIMSTSDESRWQEICKKLQ
jgi:hypothetical protein